MQQCIHFKKGPGSLFLLAILFHAMVQTGFPLQVSMRIEPAAIRMGESAQLAISIEGADRPAPPRIPDVSGLRIGEPRIEQRTSLQIVNGQTKREQLHVFRYHLMPMEPGDYEVGPITYSHRNQTVQIPAQTLRVVMPTQQGEARSLSDLVFARLSVEKENVFVQEAFNATISIYSRGVNLGRDVGLSNMPDTGIQIQPFVQLASGQEVVGEDIYDVRRYQTTIRPLTAGVIELEPILQVQLLVPRQSQRHPFFDDSFFHGFFSGMEAHPFDIATGPISISVRPLPEDGRPQDFSGGVGSFNFRVEVQDAEVQPGDPISIQFVIEGEGNHNALSTPALEDSDLFRTYSPRLVQSDLDSAGQRGKRIFEQVIIPRTALSEEIPPLTLHYFDPRLEEYRSIIQGPFSLTLLDGHTLTQRIARPDDPDNEGHIGIIGRDIRYLKPAPDRWRSIHEQRWYQMPLVWGLQVVPLLFLILAILHAQHQQSLHKDVARARRYRAPRSARPGLRQAETADRKDDEQAFYDGLWTALTAYFGDRLNLPHGAISVHPVIEAMKQQGMDDASLRALEELFNTCELRRYGHTASDPALRRALLYSFRSLLKKCGRLPS